jgi:ribosome-binding protein aMBF1 (putative translation factor)
MTKFASFEDIKKEWLKDADFAKAYADLEVEFEIALELIKARKLSGLTQGEIAAKMGTTQSVIARLESGKATPSIKTLEKYAHATGKHLHFSIV